MNTRSASSLDSETSAIEVVDFDAENGATEILEIVFEGAGVNGVGEMGRRAADPVSDGSARSHLGADALANTILELLIAVQADSVGEPDHGRRADAEPRRQLVNSRESHELRILDDRLRDPLLRQGELVISAPELGDDILSDHRPALDPCGDTRKTQTVTGAPELPIVGTRFVAVNQGSERRGGWSADFPDLCPAERSLARRARPVPPSPL